MELPGLGLADGSSRGPAFTFSAPGTAEPDEIVTQFLGGGSIPVRGGGPVSVTGASVCDAAEQVLGLALGASYSCTVPPSSIVSVYVEQQDAQSVLAAFLAAVDRLGVQIEREGGSIVLSGGRAGEAEGYGFPQPPGTPGAVPAGVQTFTLESTAEGAEIAFRDALVTLPNPTVTRLPGRVAASEVSELLDAAGVEAAVLDLRDGVYVVASRDLGGLVEAVVGGLDYVAVPISSSGASAVALEVMSETYPAVTFRADPDAALVWLSGPTGAVVGAAKEFRRHLLPVGDLRIDAAFVSVSRGSMRSAEASGRFRLLGGDGLLRSSVAPGFGSFELVVDEFAELAGGAVVSRPSVTARPGQEARFVSGQSVPVVVELEDSEDGDRSEVEYRDTGVVVTAR
ncbi:MAG: hypothetical protein AAF074_26355, partial [Pseudomonadota bacterium]